MAAGVSVLSWATILGSDAAANGVFVAVSAVGGLCSRPEPGLVSWISEVWKRIS